MKLIKKLMILWACLIFAFTTMFVVPQQKAHAILPALVAGQFVKKGATKALASVLVRQGAKSGTVITMEKAVKIAGSRMTPAQYAMFTGGLKRGVKSLDNKYVKIILGAELAGALGLLAGDMADIAERGETVAYNSEAIDKDGLTVSEALPILEGSTKPHGLDGSTATVPKRFYMEVPQIQFPGLEMFGRVQGSTFYLHLGATYPGFDSTNPATADTYYPSAWRTWGAGMTNMNPTVRFDLMYIAGISAHIESSTSVRVNFWGNTGINSIVEAPGYDSYLNASSDGTRLYFGYTLLTNAQWNDYYTNWLNKDPFFTDYAQINDFAVDETFVEQFPLTSPSETVPNELEFQIPNPDYWDLPGMKEAYYEQLQNFPGQTTVIDPNNYPTPGQEEEKDIYGDGLPYPPGTFPNSPTDPTTDPGEVPTTGEEPLPPATGEVPGTPTGTTPGTPYIPPGEGCTQALQIPRFLPLVNTLSESFPFSIPFDLYDGFQALFSEMGSARPNFKYDVNFKGEVHSWNITIPAYFDDWKPFTDSILIFIFDVGIIYAFFRFMKGGS